MAVLPITLLTVLIILFEWHQINEGYRRERIALIVISCLGWVVIIIVTFFPKVPGPSEWLDLLLGLFR